MDQKGQVTIIGMADLNICIPPNGISTLGLGSCVGVAIRDPISKVGGLAHIMLPDSTAVTGGPVNIPKYADTGIEELVKQICAKGAVKSRLVAKIAGGAQMFAFKSSNATIRVGDRNVEASIEGIADSDCRTGYGRILRKNRSILSGNGGFHYSSGGEAGKNDMNGQETELSKEMKKKVNVGAKVEMIAPFISLAATAIIAIRTYFQGFALGTWLVIVAGSMVLFMFAGSVLQFMVMYFIEQTKIKEEAKRQEMMQNSALLDGALDGNAIESGTNEEGTASSKAQS